MFNNADMVIEIMCNIDSSSIKIMDEKKDIHNTQNKPIYTKNTRNERKKLKRSLVLEVIFIQYFSHDFINVR